MAAGGTDKGHSFLFFHGFNPRARMEPAPFFIYPLLNTTTRFLSAPYSRTTTFVLHVYFYDKEGGMGQNCSDNFIFLDESKLVDNKILIRV
jgi:hypothetical protein